MLLTETLPQCSLTTKRSHIALPNQLESLQLRLLEASNPLTQFKIMFPVQVLPEKEARVIMAQVFQGLAYLNEDGRRVIHYDLKPGNILFDSLGRVRITVIQPSHGFCKRRLLYQLQSSSLI